MNIKKNILEYLFDTNKLFPNKNAVIEGNRVITFKNLDIKAKILAQFLISKNDIFNEPIAVYLPKTIESVISNIAITYSCNIYMNLDIKTPIERIKNIIDLIKPKFIITNAKYLKAVEELGGNNIIINIDTIDFEITEGLNWNYLERLDRQIDTDPLCIINTSGSTGTPKGVVLNHKSFIDFTEWALYTFNFNENEIIGSLSPLVFDIYSFELCMLMAKGSTMVLISDTLAAFPIKILNILSEQKVTFLFWVPTIMVNIANMNLLENIKLPKLKIVWFAGEVFPTKQFNYWKSNLSHTLFANLYGPIEITLDCTYYVVNRDINDDEALPIGSPCKNTDILILNENNQLVQNGEEGELCVRGTSLAMGYYNNPKKTRKAFVQNPLNKSYPEIIYRTGDIVSLNDLGEIVFKGRKDSLVKHLGYRIELGEIEHVVVNTLKMVKNGCIVYNGLKKQIILFYEADLEISILEFRKKIAIALPKYMIPTLYIRMNQLPRNTNGKIDRLKLKQEMN
ncbi:MAG: amino acid adenylation domain-containing protein [Flavobacteriaceae bacterium]|nr:amino acid adenylation domain-containing protein [Flavobacteriaceae bacterium]